MAGKKGKSTKHGIAGTVILTVFVFCVIAVVLLVCTSGGRRLTANMAAGYIHSNINYVPSEGQNSPGENSRPETPADTETNTEKEYYHILLLGEEAMKSSPGTGRTDLVMLATINIPDESIKLVSLLRDTLVSIPGYSDNKLNSVYAKGGISLLYQVMEENYGIRPDGYALVGFDGFEEIVDRLGGVSAELTAEEAEYLNRTNYISKPEYRNVVPGKQTLNGAQALGYCRVRKIANINGTNYDYGRAERQRMILESLFRQYIDAGIYKWVPIVRDVMGLVQTDISLELLQELLFAVYDNSIYSLETMQIPKAGTFESMDNVNGVTAVLVPDWEENRRLLEEFVYHTDGN